MGESTSTPPPTTSTASRAVALHNGMTEAKKAVSQERVISKMADDFFMSRIRRGPEEGVETDVKAPALQGVVVIAPQLEVASTDELVLAKEDIETDAIPREYTPRGSFVDVHA